MVNIRFSSFEGRTNYHAHSLAGRALSAGHKNRKVFYDFSRFWESLDVLSQQVEGGKEDRWDNV